MQPTQYTVKAGDTLNSIAAAHGFSDYKSANISGFGTNPDAIQPGQVLTIGGVPKTSTVPGIGTLTVTPKNIPTTTPPAAAPEDLSGAYARAGITPPAAPPPPGTANGYVPPAVAGLPTYPSSGSSTTDQIAGLKKSYQDTVDTITALESKISSSAAPSDEEKALQQKLNDAKAKLAQFDVETLQSEENLSGQGRGATLGTINTQKTILDRTRALQRLGLSTDADTIATQLSTATADRTAQGDVAKSQYDLATKKLDLALGIQDKINTLSQDEQNNARQFLLDTVNFADGKSYDQLDSDTQAAITHAVANSPITLDMVKTALKSGADKAAANAAGNLRSVAGLGVVQIIPNGSGGFSYKVVVPENANDGYPPPSNPKAPSFTDYLSQQGTPLGIASLDTINQMRDEYNAKYGTATPDVSLGKLTATQKQSVVQAGLAGTPAAVQSYYLNAPAAFQNSYAQDVASGKASQSASLDDMVAAYTKWYNAQQNGGHDWSAILGTQ